MCVQCGVTLKSPNDAFCDEACLDEAMEDYQDDEQKLAKDIEIAFPQKEDRCQDQVEFL